MTQEYFQFNLKPNKIISDKSINKISSEITDVWLDIEYLLNIFELVYSKFIKQAEKKGVKNASVTFNGLSVLGQTFYIYLDIIRKLIDRMVKDTQKKDSSIKNIYEECQEKELMNRIRKVRNLIIIHREKKWSYDKLISSIGTGPEAQIEFGGIYKDRNGTKKELKFRPIEDVYRVKKFLSDFQEKYNELKSVETNK